MNSNPVMRDSQVFDPYRTFVCFRKRKKWVPTYCYSILIGFYLCKWLTLHLNSEIFDFPSKEIMIHTGSCLKDVCQIIYGTGFSEPFDLDWSCRRIFLSDANISGMVSYLDKMVDWHHTLTSSTIFEKYMGNACRNSTLWPHVKSFTFSSVWDQGWAKWFTFGFIKSHLWLLKSYTIHNISPCLPYVPVSWTTLTPSLYG